MGKGEELFLELAISDEIMRATELAALAATKSVNDLLQDILFDYLDKEGFLRDSIDLENALSLKKND
jgi:hypothetical protein